MILNPRKTVRLDQLESEIVAAGFQLHGLVSVDDPVSAIYTYDANGNIMDIPAGAYATVKAHIPVLPAAPVQPNIPAMISAVQNSTSLDATTKTNLVSALQGK